MDLNEVTLLGRTTQDIEVKLTPNGKKVATVWVATNKKYVDSQGELQNIVTFHQVVLWEKLAETAEKYLAKWSRVLFKGELTVNSYEKEDGSKRTLVRITANQMILLGSKNADNQQNNNPQENPQASQAPAKRAVPNDEITIEDLPF